MSTSSFVRMLLLVATILTASISHAQASPKVLILYDAPVGEATEKLGFSYAIMLRNLLGHFDSAVDLLPVQNYVQGKLEGYGATFYMGDHYDAPVPPSLLSDIAATSKTIVWFKYNIWQLAWNPTYNFTARTGLSFQDLKDFDTPPTPTNPAPGFFDTVTYKNKAMVKYYAYNPTTGAVYSDPDAGAMQIVDATKAVAIAPIKNSKSGVQIPYITKSGKFWYFADIPFSYIGPRDRYLVLTDVLHDILEIPHAENHRAMVRLEDVGALVSVATMKKLSDYLYTKKIRFSVAAIPYYRDPLGAYNGGIPQQVPLAFASNLKTSLNYALSKNAEIVMHGYTHQYDSTPNRATGVSGDDYEFWNIVTNTPVSEDSTAWAAGRLNAGLLELTNNGYTPIAWEAPHYQSSPLSIKAVPAVFGTTYQRVVYYTSDTPKLTLDKSRDYAVGQFFPYVIKSDYYGQKILPENLGNIEYDIRNIDPNSNFNYTWQDLKTNAEYALVVRDGFASFFFHPFWLEPEINKPGFADFTSIVDAITGMGYVWTSPSALLAAP